MSRPAGTYKVKVLGIELVDATSKLVKLGFLDGGDDYVEITTARDFKIGIDDEDVEIRLTDSNAVTANIGAPLDPQ